MCAPPATVTGRLQAYTCLQIMEVQTRKAKSGFGWFRPEKCSYTAI